MVRFSCFNSLNHSQKPKKMMEPSVEAMHKSLQDYSQIQASKFSSKPTSLNSLFHSTEADTEIKGNAKNNSGSSSLERVWKLEKFESNLKFDANLGAPLTGYLRKCQSLGDGLYNKGLDVCDNVTEDEINEGFSNGIFDHDACKTEGESQTKGESLSSQLSEALESEFVLGSSNMAHNQCIFSVGDPHLFEKGVAEDLDALAIVEGASEYSPQVHQQMLVKSCSLPNIAPSVSPSSQNSDKYFATHATSSGNLQALEMKWQDGTIHGDEVRVSHERNRDDDFGGIVKNNDECPLDDDYDSYNYSPLSKDWIVPVADEVNFMKSIKGKSPIRQYDEVRSGDFKVKRIEAWVNDLQHCGPLEEENESVGDGSRDNILKRYSTVLNGSTNGKADTKVIPGMEIVKRYISSLNASATIAQLSNHGLVAVPFFGAFVSLKAINLSGNSIEKITAGALPRGLHALNLSKNKISSIEGLRELTRLRVLDLSYNRIMRIGHGLASCSSLKELYLAGNKISEMEGLHRLLKLTVLDLRFNKIFTAKCLGQLAANYNSLQAISLEGNPAQKNVGDEQLKKYVQGLLPHLVYYNRQPTKSGTLKDAADRSVRLGISAHQYDRGLRTDGRSVRKASHGESGSSHARTSQVAISPKRSKGRHGFRPPSGTSKPTATQPDWGSKLQDFRSQLAAIRRSQSEGTLGAL